MSADPPPDPRDAPRGIGWFFVRCHGLIARVQPRRIAFAWLVALKASAAGLPEPVIPAGVGVNIHFVKGHSEDLDLIAAAGFKWVRMDFVWEGIERKEGEYDWSAYEELTAALEKRGLGAVYILDYSNPLYEEKVGSINPLTHAEQRGIASPQRPESVAAFARWAAASARHFAGKPILWEIWNEPNITFWKPAPDAAQYSRLALATCRAIRETEPKATIIGPACSTFDWRFLETFLNSGVLEYLDAVSVHPYRSPETAPETAGADYERLGKLIQKCAGNGRGKGLPIVSGEWGYSSNTQGVSEETQAAFIARQQLANLLNGVPLSIWYDWKNDGPDPGENEHNFGTVTQDLKPKSAYLAIQTLTRELAGFRILRRLPSAPQDYILECGNNSGVRKLAAWTSGQTHSVTNEISTGRVVLELSELPKYKMVR
jgi:hypothetical protein